MPRKNYYLTIWEPGPVKDNEITSVPKRWYVRHKVMKDHWGQVQYNKKEIWIHESLKGYEYWAILNHEVTHIMLYTSDEHICDRNERTSVSLLKTVLPKIQEEITSDESWDNR